MNRITTTITLAILALGAHAAKLAVPKTAGRSHHCGSTHDLSGGGTVPIETPNHPDNYPDDTDCKWNFAVPADTAVKISCDAFDVEEQDYCDYDYLAIEFPGGKDRKCSQDLKHREHTVDAESDAYTLVLHFHSDYSVTKSGFSCKVKAAGTTPQGDSVPCGESRELGVGDSYKIASKEWPQPYGNDISCAWTFNVAAGTRTVLSCGAFEVEYEENCDYDSLSLTYGGAVRGKWCGTQLRDSEKIVPAKSSSRQLELLFETDGSVTRDGFLCTVEGMEETVEPPPPGCPCGEANHLDRIVNGEVTERDEYPWQAAIYYFHNGTHVCGGSVITKKHVLSAAHCFGYGQVSPSIVTVGVAIHNRFNDRNSETEYEVEHIAAHQADVAVLTLAEELTFSDRVRPICMPNDRSEKYAGREVTATGWGLTTPPSQHAHPSKSTLLREVQLEVTTNDVCQDQYPEATITDEMICCYGEPHTVEGKDSCGGDSGGPLKYKRGSGKYEQVGVVSWGYGCARKERPGVYARVTELLDWIEDNTTGEELCY